MILIKATENSDRRGIDHLVTKDISQICRTHRICLLKPMHKLKSVAKTPVDMRFPASPESTSGGANPAPVTGEPLPLVIMRILRRKSAEKPVPGQTCRKVRRVTEENTAATLRCAVTVAMCPTVWPFRRCYTSPMPRSARVIEILMFNMLFELVPQMIQRFGL